MYRIELAPGEQTVFRTIEELATGIRTGVITTRARIFHNASQKWLPIEFHPHYKKALESLHSAAVDLAEPPPAPQAPQSVALALVPVAPPPPPAPAAPPPVELHFPVEMDLPRISYPEITPAEEPVPHPVATRRTLPRRPLMMVVAAITLVAGTGAVLSMVGSGDDADEVPAVSTMGVSSAPAPKPVPKPAPPPVAPPATDSAAIGVDEADPPAVVSKPEPPPIVSKPAPPVVSKSEPPTPVVTKPAPAAAPPKAAAAKPTTAKTTTAKVTAAPRSAQVAPPAFSSRAPVPTNVVPAAMQPVSRPAVSAPAPDSVPALAPAPGKIELTMPKGTGAESLAVVPKGADSNAIGRILKAVSGGKPVKVGAPSR